MTTPSDENSVQNTLDQEKQLRQEKAHALMELARARKAFLTILVGHLEQSEDIHAQRAAVELRVDRGWHIFEAWYAQRGARRLFRRRIVALFRMIEKQADG
jgi:hypothetical protein